MRLFVMHELFAVILTKPAAHKMQLTKWHLRINICALLFFLGLGTLFFFSLVLVVHIPNAGLTLIIFSLVRIETQQAQCTNLVGSDLWSHSFPRVYFSQGSSLR